MKRKKRWIVSLAVFFALAFAIGVAAMAAPGFTSPNPGSELDPLITKSYIDQVLTAELTEMINTRIDERAQQMRDELGGLGGGQGAAAYQVVTLQAGERMECGVGTEVLLRVGSAHCSASDSPGLIDATTGGSIDNGTALSENHLYLVTLEGRAIVADEYTLVIARGPYTVG